LKNPGALFLKKDNLKLGIALGLIAPVFVFLIIYFARFSGYGFTEFLGIFFKENRLITFFGVWCLVGNVALFTAYINTRRDETAKGIFAVTLIYGIGILLLKILN
jgi:hypothetical protein